MLRGWMAVALVLTTSSVSWAGESKQRRSADAEVLDLLSAIAPVVEALSGSTVDTGDAPRLLADALATGTTDAQAWGRIVRWVLSEKDETVAAGLADVLQSVPPASGPEARRWDATTRAVMGAFQGVLRDAQANRRQDGEALMRNLATAAAPAVVAALRESDAATRESVLRTLRAVVAAAPELKAAIEDVDPDVRDAVGQALEQVRPETEPQSPPAQPEPESEP
jgi:hypothetical protein